MQLEFPYLFPQPGPKKEALNSYKEGGSLGSPPGLAYKGAERARKGGRDREMFRCTYIEARADLTILVIAKNLPIFVTVSMPSIIGTELFVRVKTPLAQKYI